MSLAARSGLPSAVAFGAIVLLLGHSTPAAYAATPQPPATSQTAEAKLTPTEESPSTPGPPSPTPALPEDGGPPGGVLGGYLYSDDDGDGKRSAGDSPVSTQVLVERIPTDSTDLTARNFSADADVKGRWEVRGLADGRYRVSWAPPLRDPADLERSIPPPTDIVLDPEHTVRLPNRIVEIVKANRILDINFGMPHQNPVPGAPQPQLPNTGAGDGGGVSANEAVLFAGLAASAALALGLAAGRRKSARP
jgi:hypothetical protein